MKLENMEEKIEDAIVSLLRIAVTRLPKDVEEALEKAMERERNETAKAQLKAIIKNIQLAEETGAPICQDTGTISYYLTAGDKFPILTNLPVILRRATKHATETVPLRPNAVNPFTGKNSGDNTGEHMPYIHWEIASGDDLQITAFPKGGGSENTCALGMLEPGLGVKGIKRFVVDTVIAAGAKPCPPIILGIGIGGGADIAMSLAKKALLRTIDSRHKDSEVARLEEELKTLVNQTGIGPMGLGGDTTTLGVNVEYAHHHPASLPVAVAIQCWASRRATAIIRSDGRVEHLTHVV